MNYGNGRQDQLAKSSKHIHNTWITDNRIIPAPLLIPTFVGVSKLPHPVFYCTCLDQLFMYYQVPIQTACAVTLSKCG